MKEGLSPSQIDQILAKIKPHPLVVVVDDDLATLDLIERTLNQEGYEIRRFRQAEDLLRQFSRLEPDLVVMEAILPGMSGLSVLDELRPRNLEEIIPVLILSRKEDPRAKLLAFRRGALDYLTKPFDTDELAARVRSLVRLKILQDLTRLSAVSDPLTRLYNRRFLLNWIQLEIEGAKRYPVELSCLLLELDGESSDDHLLRRFGSLLTQNVRASDLVGRLEKSQFLLLLPSTPKEGAMVVGRRLRALRTERRLPSFCAGITAFHPSDPSEPHTVLGRSQEALAKAQSVGEGQTAVLGPS